MDYLLERLKNYKILYCESDEKGANLFLSFIKKINSNVLYVKDGEEGLKLFHKDKIDIIITDIKMPKKNGIEMISEIRKENEDIPIIIISIFEEQDIMLKAINLNVTKFLLKPINKQQILNVLRDIVASLEDKKNFEKVRVIKEKLNIKDIINQFLEISVEPILIIKNNKIININKKFKKLLNKKDLNKLLKDIKYFDNLLEKKEEFKASFNDLSEENYYENKISIIMPNGKRAIFQVVIKRIQFQEEREESVIYTFQNITYIEYQKLKLKNYTEMLKDFIISSKYKKTAMRISIDKTKIETKESLREITEQNLVDNEKEKRELNEEEEKLLRKNHIEKISAQEFLNSLDDYIIEDIQELEECEEDIDIELEKFSDTPTKDILNKIIENMEKYARAIKNLQEFDELYEAINATINLLSNIDDLNENNIPKIQRFIENIILDLKSWRRTIFEEATTQDIHYLDSSLFSSCLQFELDLKGESPDENEGDFEFF